MGRRKIENRDQLLTDVDEYISNHEQVSLEELVQSMQELGHDCTPRMVRPLLKERGLTVKSVNGRWFWGVWDDDESDEEDVDDEDEEVDDEDEEDVDDDDDVDDDEDDDDDDEGFGGALVADPTYNDYIGLDLYGKQTNNIYEYVIDMDMY